MTEPAAKCQVVKPPAARGHSHREILKSSALIGGSSAINIGIGIVRTKAMALLLDPAGYGVMGAYVQVCDLARSAAQMGLNASGVRQIAEAAASSDAQRIARVVTVLRHTSIVCGLIGAVLLAVLAGPVSELTFGDSGHESAVALLGVAVFFTVVAGGQGALLQGLRRIGDMARLSVIGALAGTLIGVPMVWWLGTDGLAPTLVMMAMAALVASWWYSRRIEIAPPVMSTREMAGESLALLQLGLAFMASGLLMTGAAYAVRTIVLRQSGLDAAGIYFAAWTLGGLYLGFVLQALGTDFYPRLVGVAADDVACNHLVNEQAQVSMLLAMPGVLFTLAVAPLVLTLFYSAKFTPAADTMRWICLGMALRVLNWPLGYVVVAKNRQALFFSIEVAWVVVNVTLTWWCVEALGVAGAGIAFLGANVFHALIIYPIVRHLSGFRWTAANAATAWFFLGLITAVFVALQTLPAMVAIPLALLATAGSAWFSVRTLVHLTAAERLPPSIRRLLRLGAGA